MSELLENTSDPAPAEQPPAPDAEPQAADSESVSTEPREGGAPLRLCANNDDEPAEPAAEGEDPSEPAPEAAGEADQEVGEADAGSADGPTPDRPTAEVSTEQIVEAILFGADVPLTPAKIVSILGVGSARDVRTHIEKLNARYAQTGASFRIEKIAGGYQMLTLPEMNPWLKRLKANRQESKLSQAALETLAVVAYRQPVVRADIESIRGVATGEMLNRLRELGLVKIVGRAEDVGRPLLYGTTKRFLEVFGLGSLEDLPTVEELKAPE